MEEPRSESPDDSHGPAPSSRSRPFWRSWREKIERFMVVGAVIVRKEWELLLDPDASWIRGLRTRDRAPVALPERPVQQSFPDHLLLSSDVRELQRAARRMVEEERWYTALELYNELLRRHERSDHLELDVTLYHRIAALHRRLAVEWYVEAADHYTERSLRHGAIALCERALQLDPGQEEARHNLQWLLGRTARPPAPAEPESPPDEPREPIAEAGSFAALAAEDARPESSAPALARPEPAPHAAEEVEAGVGPPPEPAPGGTASDGVGEVFEVEPLPEGRRDRREPLPYREPPSHREVPGEETRDEEETEHAAAPARKEGRRPVSEDRPETVADPEPSPRAGAGPAAAGPQRDAEPLPDRIVLPPPDEEYEQLRRRVRRVVVGVGATLAALIVVLLIAF